MAQERSIGLKSIVLLSSVVFPALLFLYCSLTNSFPTVSTSVELLFPFHSESRSSFDYEQQYFEDLSSDFVILCSENKSFWEDSPFVLDDLETKLFSLSGIVSVVAPSRSNLNAAMGLTSQDGRCLRVRIDVSSELSESELSALHQSLTSTLHEFQHRTGIEVDRIGTFVTAQEVAGVVKRETSAIMPYVVLVLFVMSAFLLKSIVLSCVILGCQFIAFGTTLCSYSLLGFHLGPVSQLAQPFLLAVGTSFHLHVACRYLSSGLDDRFLIERELRYGLFLAASTTVISMLSLIVLNVTDVIHFALLSAGGVVLSCFYATIILPRVLDMMRRLSKPIQDRSIALPRIPAVTLWFLLVSCVLLGSGALYLEIHTDPMSFLPENNGLKQSTDRMQSSFPGGHYLRILFHQSSDGESVYEQLSFDKLAARIKSLQGVSHVVTPAVFDLSNKTDAVSLFVEDFSIHDSSIPPGFLTDSRDAFRIFVETAREGKSLLALAKDIKDVVQAELVEQEIASLQTLVVSQELILADQTNRIVLGLLYSFALTASVVFVMLLFVFRSLAIACIGMIPNIVPLLSVFGVLGFSIQYLDFGSCLVASSVLGIAVDNTFHFLLAWRHQCRLLGIASHEAIQNTIAAVSYPFSVSAMALILSFIIMVFANSQPVAHFGLLLSIALGIGLLADLYLLPLLLSQFCHNAKEGCS